MSCSIIICTYNGGIKLQTTLKAIINQETTFPWELIIIDNNSSDNTFSFSESFLKNSGIEYRVERFSKPGKMYAFWYGIELAKYDFVLDCDDDNELFPDFLEEGLKILNTKPKVGALGSLGILPEQKVPDWFNFFSKSYALGPQGNHFEPLPKFAHLYGAGCFYRKSILNDLKNKGFGSLLSCRKGEELPSGGDVEFCHAIQLLGYDLMYSETLKFFHHIGSERINFEYYLRLKRGISSSFPILASYNLDTYPAFNDFRKHLINSFFLLVKGIIKTAFLPQNNYQRKVDFVVVRAKFFAFLKNYQVAVNGYKRNQKIFGS